MRYSSFLDIEARRIGVPLHDVISYIVQRLHDVRHGADYALAFPEMGAKPGLGDRVRVFGAGRDELAALADRLVADRRFDDYAAIRMPHDIGRAQSYEAYMHVRIRTPLTQQRCQRMSEEQARVRSEIAQRVRERRLQYVKERGLPYLRLRSGSQQREFRYYIERIPCAPDGQDSLPDGYGLSRPNIVVPLPVV